MKRVPRPLYKSADEIEEQIEALQFEAMRLSPDSEQHRQIIQETARLRVYADMKRWLAAPSLKSAH